MTRLAVLVGGLRWVITARHNEVCQGIARSARHDGARHGRRWRSAALPRTLGRGPVRARPRLRWRAVVALPDGARSRDI